MDAAKTAKDSACDFIIGFGGGSPMDSAKLIALAATNPGNIWDYCQKGSGGRKLPTNQPLPVVCISTTAGTGSEADNSGMVTNPITHEKLGIGFQSLFPVLSVVDPELMRSVPPRLTAYQGLDTFFHLAEGYLSKKANYFNEMFSITGIEKIGAYLARAVIEGNDLEARENVAFANTLGGFVMVHRKTPQSAFFGTYLECISSELAPRCRTDPYISCLFRLFYRQRPLPPKIH